MLKAVIFDRDGVLIDSEYANVGATEETFKELWITINEEDKQQIIGRHPKDHLEYFHTKYTFSDDDFWGIIYKRYYDLLDKVPFIWKAINLWNRIKDDVILALNTSSELKDTLWLLKKGNMENLFTALTTAEDTQKRKPEPDSYLLTAQKLGVLPSECVAIEDSAIWLTSAKAAGMKCIIIPNAYTKNQDFSQADLIVDSADEIDIQKLRELVA